jgi:hypothetical protein
VNGVSSAQGRKTMEDQNSDIPSQFLMMFLEGITNIPAGNGRFQKSFEHPPEPFEQVFDATPYENN